MNGELMALQPLTGVLFFPATAFDASGDLAIGPLADHLDRGIAAGPGAVFPACGTGEFHALDPAEHAAVVRTAVQRASGRLPVLPGVGGSVRTAITLARAARDAGADGLLLLPPYLVQAPQDGLVAYVDAVAHATQLPLIVYHRANAVFQPATAARLAALPTVVGIKDGFGDLDLMTRVSSAVRPVIAGLDKPFQLFNGLPTAELTMPAYRGAGVHLYSSAVFAFAPEIALAFHRALSAGDEDAMTSLLDRFFVPFVALRSRMPGYAVALVKAGIRLRGLDVGGVRPPLLDPDENDLEELRVLIDRGLAAAAEVSPA